MTAPPSWLLWITSFLSIALGFFQLWQYWKNRDRIQFTQLEANQYYSVFTERDVKTWDYTMIQPEVGDPKRVFAILEFVITNNYSHSVSIGRINIGGWMFEYCYRRGHYDHARNYHVYDLHTGKRKSLDSYESVKPGESLGFRIEAYEYPGDSAARSRRHVELPSSYKIDVKTDVGSRKFKVKNIDYHYLEYDDYFKWIYRLSNSDLVPNYEPSGSYTVPQGVTHQYQKSPIKVKLKRKIHNFKYKYFGKTKTDKTIRKSRNK
jgi:hypothetical protein